jgi:hypothetical protein
MSHYTWHSLSPSAKVVSVYLFRIISFVTELFLFIYAGGLLASCSAAMLVREGVDVEDLPHWLCGCSQAGGRRGVVSFLSYPPPPPHLSPSNLPRVWAGWWVGTPGRLGCNGCPRVS